MYIETVPNRNSRPTILLREGSREGKRVVKRTLSNLTGWPAQRIEALRQLLAGRRMAPVEEAYAIEKTLAHGHLEAALEMIRRRIKD